MEKEFVFFTILMLQGDKSICTEIENKWTFRQATFITSVSSPENERDLPQLPSSSACKKFQRSGKSKTGG